MGEVLGDKDLRLQILSLPTKADLELFVHRVEKALWQDIETPQANAVQIGGRVEALESQWEDTRHRIKGLTLF